MKSRTTSAIVVLLAFAIIAGWDVAAAAGNRRTIISFGGSNVERGSGRMVTEQRNIGSFDRIESNIGADIMVSIGATQSVSLTYDDNLIGYVTTKVRGRKLVIESSRSFSSSSDCQIKIVVPRLEEVSVGGSGKIEVVGLDADRFSVEIDGSADVVASGEVGELVIEVNGSGNVDTRDLVAGEATVEINGSGDVSVMARDYLTATVNGSGDIVYTGNPSQVVKNVEGSGRIRRR
ncbi:MAG: DUF2807 domain-containing protein [candidate division Zixibacteria bacterium]|nr:DUF2807 domain-containing protein [candidate division Zixibacteria bacterium]